MTSSTPHIAGRDTPPKGNERRGTAAAAIHRFRRSCPANREDLVARAGRQLRFGPDRLSRPYRPCHPSNQSSPPIQASKPSWRQRKTFSSGNRASKNERDQRLHWVKVPDPEQAQLLGSTNLSQGVDSSCGTRPILKRECPVTDDQHCAVMRLVRNESRCKRVRHLKTCLLSTLCFHSA